MLLMQFVLRHVMSFQTLLMYVCFHYEDILQLSFVSLIVQLQFPVPGVVNLESSELVKCFS